MGYLTLSQLLVSAGIGTATAFLLFRYLGQKWIETKFAERLEQLRHSQALELQRLRVRIDSLLSGAIRLQEKEFETLPDAWLKANDATAHVATLASRVQTRTHVAGMMTDELGEYLEKLEFTRSETDKVFRTPAGERNDVYEEIFFWRSLNEANGAVHDFGGFVQGHSVFLPPELKELFELIAQKLKFEVEVLATARRSSDDKLHTECADRVESEVIPLRNRLQVAVYARLQSHGRHAIEPA